MMPSSKASSWTDRSAVTRHGLAGLRLRGRARRWRHEGGRAGVARKKRPGSPAGWPADAVYVAGGTWTKMQPLGSGVEGEGRMGRASGLPDRLGDGDRNGLEPRVERICR